MLAETNTISLFSNNVEIAENEILKLADFVYTHTNIKPMSKVIYLISRLLLIDDEDGRKYQMSNLSKFFGTEVKSKMILFLNKPLDISIEMNYI